jgi:choline dehydrogenase-like flavoprotein
MENKTGYDFIIVGAGSAGCVLANRLTEDKGARVLLVEAAGSDRHPYIQIPLGVGKLQQHRMFDFPSGPRRSRAIEDNFPPQAHIVRRP